MEIVRWWPDTSDALVAVEVQLNLDEPVKIHCGFAPYVTRNVDNARATNMGSYQ
jgi:hypothetical protein